MEQYPRNCFTFSLVAGWNKSNTASLFSVSCFIWRCLDILQQDFIRLYSPVYKFCSEGGRKIQFSTEKLFMLFFPPFFIHYLRHNRNKISRESQMEQNSPQHIPGFDFWIIYPQQSLWSKLGVYCMSLSMTVGKQYSKFGFHSSSLTLGCFAL